MLKPFFRVMPLEEAKVNLGIIEPLKQEFVDLDDGLFRVLAQSVKADKDSPEFPRATMDGHAVRSIDTFGSTESSPSVFTVVGEVATGETSDIILRRREAARIWTGRALPANADAVVMIEHTENLGQNSIEIFKAVAPFDNIIRKGEDYRRGEILLNAGLRLRPQDLGLLASLGFTRLKVYATPRVVLISTGDEIVPVNETPPPGCGRDVNGHSLYAAIKESFAEPISTGLVGDNLKSLTSALTAALEQADLVVISGGTSTVSSDYVAQAITEIPDSRTVLHGVSISPGKPLIMGLVGPKPVIGLPGHPASALVCFDQFVVPVIRRLSGENSVQPFLRPHVKAILTRNISSKEEHPDFVMVRLSLEGANYMATPGPHKSGMVSVMPRSHGYLKMPAGCPGYHKGRTVKVYLFSDWMGDDFEKEYFS
ncbi:MAG: gephyrin-like molybdotransferase Glp [Desulfomonilaceae bacterium]